MVTRNSLYSSDLLPTPLLLLAKVQFGN